MLTTTPRPRWLIFGCSATALLATAAVCKSVDPLLVLRMAKARRMKSAYLESSEWPPRQCRQCGGSGRRTCQVCTGRGALPPGGFQRRNTIRMPSLVGSQWTSVTALDGKWRHFVVTGYKGTTVKSAIARLSSTCGPVAKRITIDIPVGELKIRSKWCGGWVTLADIAANGAAPIANTCSACSGLREVPCPRCTGLGQIGL